MPPALKRELRRRLSASEYIDGILRGDRALLARAITIVESELPADTDLASAILEAVLPHSGQALRLGITGVPGAGKSTFIDALGMHVIRDYGQKLAVLSIDPSSPLSGGSILGDKTRMERLSVEDNAFIRPSPARGHLGGVSRRTRETMLLCEAAGYHNIFVETVGVGQSEVAVRSMTDFFLLILIAGAGDELQGIKRGIIEMVDGIVVNKADGDNIGRVERVRVEYRNALHLFPLAENGWVPRVLGASALTKAGIPEVWEVVLEHRCHLQQNGFLLRQRQSQALAWMHELISTGLAETFHSNSTVAARLPVLEQAVRSGSVTSFSAARELLTLFAEKDLSSA